MSCTCRRLAPFWIRWVANECRIEWGVICLPDPAAVAYLATMQSRAFLHNLRPRMLKNTTSGGVAGLTSLGRTSFRYCRTNPVAMVPIGTTRSFSPFPDQTATRPSSRSRALIVLCDLWRVASHHDPWHGAAGDFSG